MKLIEESLKGERVYIDIKALVHVALGHPVITRAVITY